MDVLEPYRTTERIVPRRRFVAPLTHTRSLDPSPIEVKLPTSKSHKLRHARSLDTPVESVKRDEPLQSFQHETQNGSEPALSQGGKESSESSGFGVISIHRSANFLKEIPLFHQCSLVFCYDLATKLQGATFYPAGYIFYKQGDPGAALFVVGHGEVSIMEAFTEGEICVAVLTKGGVFGEMEAISMSRTHNRRRSTAQAKTLCDCRFIERDTLLEVLSHYAPERQIMETEMMRRLQFAPLTSTIPEIHPTSEDLGNDHQPDVYFPEIGDCLEREVVQHLRRSRRESQRREIERLLDIDPIDTAHRQRSSSRNPSKQLTDPPHRSSSRKHSQQSTDSWPQSTDRNPSKQSTDSQTSRRKSSEQPIESAQQSSRNPSKQSARSESSSRKPRMQSTNAPTTWRGLLDKFQRGIVMRSLKVEQPDKFAPVLGG